jgi:hypothetical protein
VSVSSKIRIRRYGAGEGVWSELMIEADLLEVSGNCEFASAAGTRPAGREAAYVWDLTTDQIQWDRDAGEALGFADLSRIATGRAYAMLHDGDAVEDACEPRLVSPNADQGVPYRTKYWLHPGGGTERLWVEDIGCWHRDSGNAPVRAIGVLRVLLAELV